MRTKRILCALFCAVLLGTALTAPVQAVDWLKYPFYLPMDTEAVTKEEWKETYGAEGMDLCGVYYAEGYGLELTIYVTASTSTGELYLNADFFDYTSGQLQTNTVELSDDGAAAREAQGNLTITRESDTSLRVDFAESFLQEQADRGIFTYKNPVSVTFTDVWEMKAGAADDPWTGTYRYRILDQDRDYYLSVERLYGTHDYMTFLQSTLYGTDEGYGNYSFYTESEDGNMLLHEYAGGVVTMETTYGAWARDETGALRTFYSPLMKEELAGSPEYSDEVYNRFAWTPIWESTIS